MPFLDAILPPAFVARPSAGRRFLAPLAVLSLAISSLAWTPLEGPRGGFIARLDVRGSTLYASGIGFLASDDCGDTWRDIDQGLPPWPYTADFFARESGLWALNPAGVVRRPQGAVSWIPWNEGLPSRDQRIRFDKLRVSGDRAALFLRTTTFNGCLGFLLGPGDAAWQERWRLDGTCPQVVATRSGWVLGWNRERRPIVVTPGDSSMDLVSGGDTARIGMVHQMASLGDTALLVDQHARLFRSVDGGLTWRFADSLDFLYNMPEPEVIWSAGTSFFIGSAGKPGLRRSDDGGATWQVIPVPDSLGIEAAARCGGRTVAASGRGLFRSTAAGGWEPLSDRLHRENLLGLAWNGGRWIAIDARNGHARVVARAGGDSRWRDVALADSFFFDLKVAGAQVIAHGGEGVWRSGDGGSSWAFRSFNTSQESWSPEALGADGARAAALGGDHLALSDDTGRTWTSALTSFYGASAVQPVGEALVAGKHAWDKDTTAAPDPWTSDGGIHLSRDSGKTWTRSGLRSIGIRELAMTAGKIFAATDSGLYVSQNLAGSWTRIPFAGVPAGALAADVRVQGRAVATILHEYDADGMLLAATAARSEDAGATWTLMPAGAVMAHRIAFGPEGGIALGTLGSGILLWDGVAALQPRSGRPDGIRVSVHGEGRARLMRYALAAPGAAHLELFDARGRRLHEIRFEAARAGELELPALARGVVLGRFSGPGGSVAFRMR